MPAERTYLVTGGLGFLGSALARRLVAEGHRVRVFDNAVRGSRERLRDLEDRLEIVDGDIRDAKAVTAAAEGVDSVCHLAFINGTEFFYSQPELVLDVGVKGITHVLDACRIHRIGELLLMSSSEVYQTPPAIPTGETVPLTIPDPLNPRYSYAAGKIISEVMALNYGRTGFERVLIVRPHNVYGPDMGWEHVIPQFILRMRELSRLPERPVRFPVEGDGRQTRAFVYVDDFIDGLLCVLERGAHLGTYHIGTGDEVPIERVAKLVGSRFGCEVEIVPMPSRPGSVSRRCPDISKVAALGYRPHCALEDGIAQTVTWYDAHADEQPLAGLRR
jgi:nucleoside-diphosphate-sugar epimerase